ISDNYANAAGAGFTGTLVITGLEFNESFNDAGATITQALTAIFVDKWSKSPATFTSGADTRTDGDATTQAAANKTKFETTATSGNKMVTTATKTKGADKTKFTGWTLADTKGKLTDF
ncbi:MAG: hypothetical protein RIA63_10845, partial [Cyclobacteriaceae bacterium]